MRDRFLSGLIVSLSLAFAADLYAAPKAAAPQSQPAAKEVPTHIGDLLDKVSPHLVDSEGKKVELKGLKDKPVVAFYWSASWCGPCRQFTPQLVEYYKTHGGGKKFEIIFIGLDKTEQQMIAYMKSHEMKWPAIKFEERRGTGIKQFAGSGIPRLMIADKEGKILHCGSAFVGLAQLKKLIGE